MNQIWFSLEKFKIYEITAGFGGTLDYSLDTNNLFLGEQIYNSGYTSSSLLINTGDAGLNFTYVGSVTAGISSTGSITINGNTVGVTLSSNTLYHAICVTNTDWFIS